MTGLIGSESGCQEREVYVLILIVEVLFKTRGEMDETIWTEQ